MSWSGRVAVFLLAAAVAVASVALLRRAGFFADEPPYSLCPADRAGTTVVRPSRMLAEARPYTGTGPHRIVIDADVVPDLNDIFPAAWRPAREDKGAYRLETVELVVCGYVYAVGDEGDLSSCTWNGAGKVYKSIAQSAKYDFRVFEAATGRPVTTFTLPGVAGKPESCPTIISGARPTMMRLPASPSDAELKSRLEPLVTRSVG